MIRCSGRSRPPWLPWQPDWLTGCFVHITRRRCSSPATARRISRSKVPTVAFIALPTISAGRPSCWRGSRKRLQEGERPSAGRSGRAATSCGGSTSNTLQPASIIRTPTPNSRRHWGSIIRFSAIRRRRRRRRTVFSARAGSRSGGRSSSASTAGFLRSIGVFPPPHTGPTSSNG